MVSDVVGKRSRCNSAPQRDRGQALRFPTWPWASHREQGRALHAKASAAMMSRVSDSAEGNRKPPQSSVVRAEMIVTGTVATSRQGERRAGLSCTIRRMRQSSTVD